METPTKLAFCTTEKERLDWVQRVLTEGRIVCDMSLWLAGVESPKRLIQALRKRGLAVVATKKWVQDVANVWHHDTAWRLDTTPDQPDPRTKDA